MEQTILVVDDQADERSAMATLLRGHRYLVESASNGLEALDRLRCGAPLPALVLLDLNMPVMDGWEFLFFVARDSSLCHVPVIILSGSPVVQEAIVVPPYVTFLAKPVRAQVLIPRIAEMLQQAVFAASSPGQNASQRTPLPS